eukprot:TRINITY_DN11289_c0_g3_i1.p1 TRINITY_DN11289_c0_g3~~TRINITY_DN11289_c0_g3_i1.p1  ORF type:complete len:502 (+),score=153.18 TRINITY_DN11289_c0_g3_i1:197-1507(+)
MALAAAVFVTGAANMFGMAALWALYTTLVNVGQRWYEFGWESQLLETGFLAIWAVPAFAWRRFPDGHPTPYVVVLGYRWLIMRIMLGAGLIKIRGDPCWRDLTCMDYFYETAPNPNPASWYAHHMPEWWHRLEVLGNHVVELALPWLTILPWRAGLMANGAAQVLFQGILIATGNLSFLNWLTIVPALWYFDDGAWAWAFSTRARRRVDALNVRYGHAAALPLWRSDDSAEAPRLRKSGVAWCAVHAVLGAVLVWLSVPIVTNLLSPEQRMNTSFGPWRIVNTYGAFGSVTKTRTEVVLEGTASPDPRAPDDQWAEYKFPCKPGNVTRAPCLISPYHYRLDWLMWFAAFQSYQHNPWLLHLAGKLLANDAAAAPLLARNPFDGGPPPQFIRAVHYEYTFAPPGSSAWWTRKRVGIYLEPVNRRSLRQAFDHFGWKL